MRMTYLFGEKVQCCRFAGAGIWWCIRIRMSCGNRSRRELSDYWTNETTSAVTPRRLNDIIQKQLIRFQKWTHRKAHVHHDLDHEGNNSKPLNSGYRSMKDGGNDRRDHLIQTRNEVRDLLYEACDLFDVILLTITLSRSFEWECTVVCEGGAVYGCGNEAKRAVRGRIRTEFVDS